MSITGLIIIISAYNPFVIILMYILSCLVVSIKNNLWRIGMLFLIISIISVTHFSKDNRFGGIWLFLLSLPLFIISLLMFLVGFISKKTSVSKRSSLEENEPKHRYPVLTKIAAWWLILLPLKPFLDDFGKCLATDRSLGCYVLALLASASLFVINFSLGFFLLKKRKRAWWMSMIILVLPLIVLLFNKTIFIEEFLFPDVSILFFIVPIFLLLIDSKKFFEIAE